MHTIFSAGIRIVLLKSGITNFYIHFAMGLAFGIYGPIVVEKMLSHTKYLEVVIHPYKIIKEIK